MPADLPASIGRYRIIRLLGQGAMGTVHLARDAMIQRQVAVKSLRLDRLHTKEQRRRAADCFLQEARIVGNLNHSHITAVYDMGVQEGVPYLVMEYVDGDNLKEIIRSGQPFGLKEKLTLIAMVARALHYAHQRGVLHRDIKPANIMILHKNRSPKITDFGIARVMDPCSLGIDGPQAEEELVPGTPLYMSPEQVRGDQLDPRSDLFSLGILAYEWLSGRKPFTGETISAQLNAILTATPAPLGGVAAVDVELTAIIAQALAKDPAERFQCAEEFSDTLELYLNRLERREEGVRAAFSDNQRQIIARLRKKYLFFADFSEAELFTIFQLSTKERFAPEEYLIREGSSGTKMYVILTGTVAVVTESEGRRVVIDTLSEGGCVGEMALLDRMPRSASVVAVKETVAMAINETVLRLANPKLCLKLYRSLAAILAERLRASDARYLELAAVHAREKK
ncbi:MAG: serine/threonine-protein kinase [Thermodesulfobacteriota bacterium]